MRTGHLQNKTIKVAGHLEDRRGYYHIVLNWIDRSGNRGRKSISTGFPVKGNKKRAEEMMRLAKREQQEIVSAMPEVTELLFADFMKQWLEVIKPDIKLTTYGGYCMNVRSAIGPYFRERGILLRELTADDINDFYAEQLETVKATTVHKYHANISKALKYAVKKGMVPYSVMDKVDRPKPERFVGKFLKQSETIELFEAVKGHKLELGVILGAFYGLRRAEIIGLRWESIDFEANSITIEHTVTVANVDGKRILVVDDTTKSKASFRTLPLVPEFRAKLLAVKEEQEHYRKLCGNSYNKVEGKYIYTDQLGNRVRPDYLSSAFPKFMEEHGFRRLRFHDLRHSCASLLLANGVPLKQIQEWLGHSDFAITANTYAHLEFDSKLKSAQAMTWIEKTSLAQTDEAETERPITANTTNENSQPMLAT
ncbi:site-specific integrase [Ruminococcaceae bacterium OttesenSCG-928-A11]|nr:site-specific integrase [Ruminococcaceae bacterium OttesenSCG-928-I18]MDL2327800.1 site-specific integrase [Ruminococcaceae bacterium OttesenSCG-928-A11]